MDCTTRFGNFVKVCLVMMLLRNFVHGTKLFSTWVWRVSPNFLAIVLCFIQTLRKSQSVRLDIFNDCEEAVTLNLAISKQDYSKKDFTKIQMILNLTKFQSLRAEQILSCLMDFGYEKGQSAVKWGKNNILFLTRNFSWQVWYGFKSTTNASLSMIFISIIDSKNRNLKSTLFWHHNSLAWW